MKMLQKLLPLALTLLLSHCASRPPHAPGDDAFSGVDATTYRRAYYHGLEDGKRSREDDFERYHSEYTSETAKAFQRGYSQGYEIGRENAEAGVEASDDAFNQGVELGRADSNNSQPPNYQRHHAAYTAGTESSFRRGYAQGYRESQDDNSGASSAEKKAYDAGYRTGELDREGGQQPDAESHRDEVSKPLEEAFFKGYRDGFNRRTPRF